MREATGELNMTVVVVVLVAALVAFFSMVIWPLLNKNLKQNTGCSNAVCEACDTQLCKCHLPDSTEIIYCVNRG